MSKNVEQNKELFINTLKRFVNRDGVAELINWLNSSDFFLAPASTRYHGSHEGGLCEHSINVEKALCIEMENTFGDDWEEVFSREEVVIVSLLHDLCKANSYEQYERNVKIDGEWEQVTEYRRNPKFHMGHGPKSMFIAQQFIKLTPTEAQAINFHMGAFDTSQYSTVGEVSEAYKVNTLAFLLHIADYKATYLYENELIKDELLVEVG